LTESPSGFRAATLAACLSLAAGLIHLVAAPEHLQEWWGYGYFFLAAGIGQVLYGQFLFRQVHRGRAFYASGLLGTLAIIGLYVVTRTVGIPFFGPDAAEREAVSALDVGSKIVELALIVVLGWLTLSEAAIEAETSSSPAPAPAVIPLDALPFGSPVAHTKTRFSRRAALLALGGGAGLAGIWAITSVRSGFGHLTPLAAAEGSVSSSVTPVAGGTVHEYQLTAGVTKWQLSEQQPVDAWTYNGQLPGPEIRAKVGDVVRVNF
jgi:hypothetical protein